VFFYFFCVAFDVVYVTYIFEAEPHASVRIKVNAKQYGIECINWNWLSSIPLSLQVDLRHMCEVDGTAMVQLGIDLSEFYMSVEWDILAVPAIRWVIKVVKQGIGI
jgi:hypothetical protein